jgi:hypothetical protein
VGFRLPSHFVVPSPLSRHFPQPVRNVELRDEVAIEQISNMFPNYDRDMVYEMFVAYDGDSGKVVDALLAMEPASSQ